MNPAISDNNVLVNLRGCNDGSGVVHTISATKTTRAIAKYEPIFDKWALFTKNVQAIPPPEYIELVEAATAMYKALHSSKLCGHCFAGELQNGYGQGCCDPCVQLSKGGCVAKPIMCASFFCRNMATIYPREITTKLEELDGKVGRIRKSTYYPYRDRGYSIDMDTQWTMAQLIAMRRLAKEYRDFTETLKEFKLDWDVALPKLQYKPNKPQLIEITGVKRA
jgi:hypothetical protein